ncbi:MAG: hypothetical protein HXS48_11135 [Theionarchaea archaeon]|nr:MAG: hypothetical protein AYK19_21970 [Theionarchaea archaeon DG-70-1]MBU7027479.1 hypothetical protein [Theionarchaea archaeon]
MVLFGEYFRIGEIIALITMIFSFIIIYRICWRRKTFKKIVLAYFFFLLSTVLAIFREYFLFDLMRHLEHVMLVCSSALFLYIAYTAHKNLVGG